MSQISALAQAWSAVKRKLYFSTYRECPRSTIICPCSVRDAEPVGSSQRSPSVAAWSSSIFVPFAWSRSSHRSSRATRRLILTPACPRSGSEGLEGTQFSPLLRQDEQGLCPSHLIFLCWHNRHECPRVIVREFDMAKLETSSSKVTTYGLQRI